MTSGVPPTARKARTGLFTPPTRISWARRNISSERGREDRFTGALRGALTGFQPAGHILGVIGEHDAGAGAVDCRQNLQHAALLVKPAVARRGFHHGVFAADVVRS